MMYLAERGCTHIRRVSLELRNVSSELRNVSSELRNVSSELRNVSLYREGGVCITQEKEDMQKLIDAEIAEITAKEAQAVSDPL